MKQGDIPYFSFEPRNETAASFTPLFKKNQLVIVGTWSCMFPGFCLKQSTNGNDHETELVHKLGNGSVPNSTLYTEHLLNVGLYFCRVLQDIRCNVRPLII